MSSLSMNVQPDAVFNTFLHDTLDTIPYSMADVSFDPEAVQLQMEEIRQEFQDYTFYYLINIPTPNTNLLDDFDDTTN